MDEDFERSKALALKTTEVVVEAYHRRYPKMDEESSFIVVNSLLLALTTYLRNMPSKKRDRIINEIISDLWEETWNE
jgi:hypothetical protein